MFYNDYQIRPTGIIVCGEKNYFWLFTVIPDDFNVKIVDLYGGGIWSVSWARAGAESVTSMIFYSDPDPYR